MFTDFGMYASFIPEISMGALNHEYFFPTLEDGTEINGYLTGLGELIADEDHLMMAFGTLENVEYTTTTNDQGVYSTGSTIQLFNASTGELLATYVVVVIGDTNADGYVDGAAFDGGKAEKAEAPQSPKIAGRLIASIALLIPLMYVSMGHPMAGWPVPAFLENPAASGLYQLLLSGLVMVVNQKFFINGFGGLLKRAPNMDTLVALGSGASFVYSTAVLFLMSADLVAGDVAGAFHRLHGLYFESAAMILALITVGKLLEARAKGKTTDALKSLMSLTPDTATILRDGVEVTVPAAEVETLVREGKYEAFPAAMAEAAPRARDAYDKTGDPRQIDAVLDAACFADMMADATACGDTVLTRWLMVKIDLINVLICLRVLRLGAGFVAGGFPEELLLPGGTLPASFFREAYEAGESGFWDALTATDYYALARVEGDPRPLSAVEKACDDLYVDRVRADANTPFGAPVVGGYLVGWETAVKNIRIILAAKDAGLDNAVLRERVRVSYV